MISNTVIDFNDINYFLWVEVGCKARYLSMIYKSNKLCTFFLSYCVIFEPTFFTFFSAMLKQPSGKFAIGN